MATFPGKVSAHKALKLLETMSAKGLLQGVSLEMKLFRHVVNVFMQYHVMFTNVYTEMTKKYTVNHVQNMIRWTLNVQNQEDLRPPKPMTMEHHQRDRQSSHDWKDSV